MMEMFQFNPSYTFDEMYQALLNKDVNYDGKFFTGVKTTGIFCRPTCTAKKPKQENVEFFYNPKEAMSQGYRPCKVCHPMNSILAIPNQILKLLSEIDKNPAVKINDQALRDRDIDPAMLRRWFLKNTGMTFHAYQRLSRINLAFQKIKKGNSVLLTAYESGFDSVSGFQDSFKNILGFNPSESKQKNIISYTHIETPLGTMLACATDMGLCLLEFNDRKMLENELKDLAKRIKGVFIQQEIPIFNEVELQLQEYFEGKRKNFDIKLFTPGSEFQQKVWRSLQNIPYADTVSYQYQANVISQPTATRAVANANGLNRIAIIIPCHRVIGADGSLTGYGGGVWRKKKLLDLEKASLK